MIDYLSYWSLCEPPFGRAIAPQFFAGTPQRLAIAKLHDLVAGRDSWGLLRATAGCGMSMLLRHVAASRGLGDCAVQMLYTSRNHAEPRQVYAELGRAMRLDRPDKSIAEQVTDAIEATSRQSIRTVWLIDGCDRATARVARQLWDRELDLSVVIGTNQPIGQVIAWTGGACPLKIDLPPLSLEDTIRFISFSLRSAASRKVIFSDAAVVRLHELADGRIGMISRVAELALLMGASQARTMIDTELIDAVQAELVRAA